MRVTLRLEIDYDISALTHAGIGEDESLDEIQSVLDHSINRLVSNGGLSGDTLAIVDCWDCYIERK